MKIRDNNSFYLSHPTTFQLQNTKQLFLTMSSSMPNQQQLRNKKQNLDKMRSVAIPSFWQVIKNTSRQGNTHQQGSAKLYQTSITAHGQGHKSVSGGSQVLNQQVDPIAHHGQTHKGQQEVQNLQQALQAPSAGHSLQFLQSLQVKIQMGLSYFIQQPMSSTQIYHIYSKNQ